MNKAVLAAAIAIVFLLVSGIIGYLSQIDEEEKPAICKGTAACFMGKVTAVTDGDTIKVEGIAIRLALASAPELHESGGINAREFTLKACPVGSTVTVDEDDGQREGSFGRTIAAVYCGDKLLNAALLDYKLGIISKEFCGTSEFGKEDWAKRNGC